MYCQTERLLISSYSSNHISIRSLTSFLNQWGKASFLMQSWSPFLELCIKPLHQLKQWWLLLLTYQNALQCFKDFLLRSNFGILSVLDWKMTHRWKQILLLILLQLLWKLWRPFYCWLHQVWLINEASAEAFSKKISNVSSKFIGLPKIESVHHDLSLYPQCPQLSL